MKALTGAPEGTGGAGDVRGCPYRSLTEELDAYAGNEPFAELITPWLATHASVAEQLASLRERGRSAVPTVAAEELWELYALSRLCNTLVQAASSVPKGPGSTSLSMQQVEEFLGSLGIDTIWSAIYSPFHHEIVSTTAATNRIGSPRILAWRWPCLMLGSLLILRGGVTVVAHERLLAPGIADASTLYWAYSRDHRPCHDLAHGWGQNSARQTAFRRDYYLNGTYHFNVDAPTDLSQVDPGHLDQYGLTVGERIELLTHRSFVTCSREHRDLFPYSDRFSMQDTAAQGNAPTTLWKRLFG